MKKLKRSLIVRASLCEVLIIFIFFGVFPIIRSQGAEALDHSFYQAKYKNSSELKTEVYRTIENKDKKVSYQLTDYERDLVERVVMAEAGNQPYKGQMAVAQCILDSAKASKESPADIVLAKNQYASPVKYRVSSQVKKAVSAVFDDGKVAIDADIRYFYAPKYCYSAWHESRHYAGTIGDHKFFE